MPADQRDRRAVLADAAIDLLAEEGMRALTHRAVDTRAGLPQGTTSAYYRTRAALLTGIVKRLADRDREDLRALGLDLDSEDEAAAEDVTSEPTKAAASGTASDAASEATDSSAAWNVASAAATSSAARNAVSKAATSSAARNAASKAAASSTARDAAPEAAAGSGTARDAANGTMTPAPAPAPHAGSLLAGPPSPELLDAIAEGTAGFIDASLAGARNRTLARYQCRLESVTSPELRRLLAPHEDAAFRQTRDLLASLATPDVDARARAYVAAIDGLIFDRLVKGAPETPGTPENRAALTTAVRTLLAGAVSPRG